MLIKFNLLLLLSVVFLAEAYKGVDISKLYNQSVYDCFKQSGFTFAIPRAYHSYGAIDANAV